MELLIIGNGFDLNLNLDTSYECFINSNHFKEVKNNELFRQIRAKINIKNWIDLEVELKQYSKKLIQLSESGKIPGRTKEDSILINSEKFKTEFRILKETLNNYLYFVEKNAIIDRNNIVVKNLKVMLERSSNNLTIVNFNYTNTLENFFDENQNTKIFNIHGRLNNDIIFGTEDLNDEIHNDHSFILKSAAPSFGQIYRLRNEISNFEKIYFFGYSFGETDFNYYKQYFEEIAISKSFLNKEIIFFFHGESISDNTGAESIEFITKNFRKLLGSKLADFKLNCKFVTIPTGQLKSNII